MKTQQKIIKIGSSAGVTIPKKQLKESGLNIGDEVKINIQPTKPKKHDKLMHDYDAFVKEYGSTLKNLTNR